MLRGREDTRKSIKYSFGEDRLKPGNFTHRTENRHDSVQKGTQKVTSCANFQQAVKTMGNERSGKKPYFRCVFGKV